MYNQLESLAYDFAGTVPIWMYFYYSLFVHHLNVEFRKTLEQVFVHF